MFNQTGKAPRGKRIEINPFNWITVEKNRFLKSFVISLELGVIIVRLSQMRAVLFITPGLEKLMNI